MKKKYKLLIIFGLVIFACFMVGTWLWKINFYAKRFDVSKEQLLKVIKIVRLEDFKDAIGDAADHEFTIRFNNHEYVLMSCSLKKGYSNAYWFLFEDMKLKKIMLPIYRSVDEDERSKEKGSKSKIIEDDIRIQKVLSSAGLTDKQIIDDINQLEDNNKGESWNILPAFILATPFIICELPRMASDYKINYEFKKKYDGFRAHLGMSPKQTDDLFGGAVLSYNTLNGDSVKIYGDEVTLDINPLIEFSQVATVFRDNKLIKVLSNSFFILNDGVGEKVERMGQKKD